jgi:hypothetical protein
VLQHVAANGDVESVQPTGYVTRISFPFVLGTGEFSFVRDSLTDAPGSGFALV